MSVLIKKGLNFSKRQTHHSSNLGYIIIIRAVCLLFVHLPMVILSTFCKCIKSSGIKSLEMRNISGSWLVQSAGWSNKGRNIFTITASLHPILIAHYSELLRISHHSCWCIMVYISIVSFHFWTLNIDSILILPTNLEAVDEVLKMHIEERPRWRDLGDRKKTNNDVCCCCCVMFPAVYNYRKTN